MGRSPQLWKDPDVFDPQRWDRPFDNPNVKGWRGYDPKKRTGYNKETGKQASSKQAARLLLTSSPFHLPQAS